MRAAKARRAVVASAVKRGLGIGSTENPLRSGTKIGDAAQPGVSRCITSIKILRGQEIQVTSLSSYKSALEECTGLRPELAIILSLDKLLLTTYIYK